MALVKPLQLPCQEMAAQLGTVITLAPRVTVVPETAVTLACTPFAAVEPAGAVQEAVPVLVPVVAAALISRETDFVTELGVALLSFAVIVTGNVPDTVGAPLITLPDKINPAGKLVAL